jgi:cobalt-zinc-cadmium efflux system membrane fusion protein
MIRLAVALSCAAALAVAACGHRAEESEAGDSSKAEVAAATAVASVQPFTRVVPAIGSVVPRPGHFAALGAPAPGRVARVVVAPGDRVAKGAPLVQLEQASFAAAAGGANAALSAAEQAYERAERLSREGIAPRRDVEQAAAELAAARSTAVAARRAEQLSTIRSPIAGVVTRMSAVLGAQVDAGQTLVVVGDPSAFDVELSVGPTEAADIRAGARVTLTAGEKTGGDSLGTGTVTSVAAAVDSGSRAVSVRVTPASVARALRLGESVYGEIAVGTRPDAVVVPVEALVPADGEGYRVFVVGAQGRATARTVTVGGRTEHDVEILSGLKGGERVVTRGAFGLEDGARVTTPAAK